MMENIDKLGKKLLNEVNLDEIAPRVRDRSPVAHWTPAILLERAAYLRKLAKFGNGSASETIRESSQHSVLLSYLGRSGDAELYPSFAQVIHVLAGTATLAAGGTIAGARAAEHGGMRGTSIQGGTRQEIRAGDVVHVPQGIAHQILLADDKGITCVIVRIQETPDF